MTNPNDPVHPFPIDPRDGCPAYGSGSDLGGLTKRELFAAMAMQGRLSNPNGWGEKSAYIASWAVHDADALLAELGKGEKRAGQS